jgi:hypothetical protein
MLCDNTVQILLSKLNLVEGKILKSEHRWYVHRWYVPQYIMFTNYFEKLSFLLNNNK